MHDFSSQVNVSRAALTGSCCCNFDTATAARCGQRRPATAVQGYGADVETPLGCRRRDALK
eukprot:1111853-Pleurochrysis_carterae.AAC.1